MEYPKEFYNIKVKDSDEFGTPQNLFDKVNNIVGKNFTLDAAASADNYKVDKYYTKEDNGLIQSWKDEVVWCNPPYSLGNLDKWMHKGYLEATVNDVHSVFLVPPSTGTQWFAKYAAYGYIMFITGRLRHEDKDRQPTKYCSRHDSMLVYFDGKEVIYRSPLQDIYFLND